MLWYNIGDRSETARVLSIPYAASNHQQRMSLQMATSNSTLQIQLTKGFVALVDECDADLALHRWRVIPKSGGRFYAARNITVTKGIKRTVEMHRVILERVMGRALHSDEMTDHIDGNGLNNRRDNLRLASNTQNQQNARRSVSNTSGYKGVRFNKGRWMARISVDGKRLYLGTFATPELAYQAYCVAAIAYHKEFARLA